MTRTVIAPHFIAQVVFSPKRFSLLVFLLFSFFSMAQSVGDYMTFQDGPWDDPATWVVFNGTAWVPATDFPGYVNANNEVVIDDGIAITFSDGDNISFSYNKLTITYGSLVFNDNASITLGIPYLELFAKDAANGEIGELVWIKNADIYFPENTVFKVNGGNIDTDNNCSNSQSIYIGDEQFSTCKGNGVPGGSFEDIVDAGGTDCVNDTTAPTPDVASLPDITAECELTTLTAPTATDNCSGGVTVINDATLPIRALGTTVVTWTYEDAKGNTSTQTQNVVITDVTPPTASNLSPLTVNCLGDIPNPDVNLIVDESDNCSLSPTVAFVNDLSDGLSNPETITRTYSVTDDAGNSINVTQLITINKFEITSQPMDVDAFAGDDVSFIVSAINVDTYQWQVSINGGVFSNLSDDDTYSGSQDQELIVNNVDVQMNGYKYKVLLSNSSGSCPGIESDEAILQIGVRTVITNRNKTYRVNKN